MNSDFIIKKTPFCYDMYKSKEDLSMLSWLLKKKLRITKLGKYGESNEFKCILENDKLEDFYHVTI